MDNRLNVTVLYHEKVGGYQLYGHRFDQLYNYEKKGLKMGLNFTALTPIRQWTPWYYYTLNPPLVWKNEGAIIEIDIQSTVCFLLLMFLSAAVVYFSTRCLRHWFPTTTGFSTILWDFFATLFFEPFPSDSEILSIRLVFSFWLLGITIFCNDVNAVFKGKLSVKVPDGVQIKEDLRGYKFNLESPVVNIYSRYAHRKHTTVLFGTLPYNHQRYSNGTIVVSKTSAFEKLKTQIVWWGNIESSPLKYDPRIHEPIMNWELRLYEGTTGVYVEEEKAVQRLRDAFDKNVQFLVPYEMADLSLPFQLYGYGMAVAIAAKFIETILAIYNNRKPKPEYPKPS